MGQNPFNIYCDRLLLQSVQSITTCDRLSLQSISGIIKWNKIYYKVSLILQSVTVNTKPKMTFKELEPRIGHYRVLIHLEGISNLFTNEKHYILRVPSWKFSCNMCMNPSREKCHIERNCLWNSFQTKKIYLQYLIYIIKTKTTHGKISKKCGLVCFAEINKLLSPYLVLHHISRVATPNVVPRNCSRRGLDSEFTWGIA